MFNIAHNITCDADGWVYVADRENHRIQVFDGNGVRDAVERLAPAVRPVHAAGQLPVCYVGELRAAEPVNRNVPNLGPRVPSSTTPASGSRGSAAWSRPWPDRVPGAHGLAVDCRGDLYVGEVSWTG